MRRAAIVLLFFGVAPAADPAPKPRVNTVELNGHMFTLPEGFTIELVAIEVRVTRARRDTTLARIIHLDLTLCGVSAWQWWTAVSPVDYKDGLI